MNGTEGTRAAIDRSDEAFNRHDRAWNYHR